MIDVKAYAAMNATTPLAPFTCSRREVGRHDVLIDIHYCGVCHSDAHQARDEWAARSSPWCPGMKSWVRSKVGASAKQFKVGQMVGVGCFVDSCRTCPACKKGLEQYCEGHLSFTINGTERDGVTPTYGGYSTKVVVDQRYVVRIPKQLRPEEAATLVRRHYDLFTPATLARRQETSFGRSRTRRLGAHGRKNRQCPGRPT